MVRQVFHGMIGLQSNNKTHWQFCLWDDQLLTTNPGIVYCNCTNYQFCPNPTLLRGVVICWVKGAMCRVDAIMRNWATTHFQVRSSRFFRHDMGIYGSETMGTHNAHNWIEWSCSAFFNNGTMVSTSPAFGFMGFLVSSSFALFHPILATCSSHTGMSCMLFSRWWGASPSHQHL